MGDLIMESLIGKKIYRHDSTDNSSKEFVIAEVVKNENGYLVKSKDGKDRLFVNQEILADIKYNGVHRHHIYYFDGSMCMIEITIHEWD